MWAFKTITNTNRSFALLPAWLQLSQWPLFRALPTIIKMACNYNPTTH